MTNSQKRPPKELRGRWYLQSDKYHKTVKEVSLIFGISRKTFYKWYNIDHRFSSNIHRPKRLHPQTHIVGQVCINIRNAKLKYNYGPKKMSIFLKKEYGTTASPSAIYKFYKKKDLIRKPQKQQKWYQPLKNPFKAVYPGENVQNDVKYVPGKDCSWNYQYRFIDQASNLQFSVTLKNRDATSSIKALKLAQKYFPFTITGIQTDNGGEFRGKYHEYLIRNIIIHRYIPKRSAPWNGKVERANRSVDDEFYLNTTRPWNTIIEYTDWYNYERPHLGKFMNGMTPYEKFLSLSPKKCNPTR